MNATIQEQLHDFTTALLERHGAVVDWPSADEPGAALAPPEVADVLGAAEVIPLSCDTAAGGLAVNLAGEFLERAGRLLDAEPCIGRFRIRELYLKRKELDETIARTFTWLNARVKMRDTRQTTAEYHTWWFHGVLSSEDRWETCLSFSLNAASGVEVEIPEPLGLWELEPRADDMPAAPSTYAPAVEVARRRLIAAAAGFLQRIDARLERDRKRLHDYYHALLRETDKKKPRGNATPDPEKASAAKRAVQLELRRKLAELDERYAMEATLRPVILVRTELPVLAVDLSVFRKQARREHTIYWNPLLKQFEPMRCGRCGAGVKAVTFENDTVTPLCPDCAAR